MKTLMFPFIFLFIISPGMVANHNQSRSGNQPYGDEISRERIENCVKTLVGFHTLPP